MMSRKSKDWKLFEENKAKGIFFDAVQLTRGQAAALARDLHDFATHREEETYE